MPLTRRESALTEDELRFRIRRNVRVLREDASLTVKQAAARVGLHPRHWQKVEEGSVNITLWTLVRVAIALGVDSVTLLCEAPVRGPATSNG